MYIFFEYVVIVIINIWVYLCFLIILFVVEEMLEYIK